MTLEELHFALVLFRFRPRSEPPQVEPMAGCGFRFRE
jgi:hypothetical protein